jgi:hypothetical protein
LYWRGGNQSIMVHFKKNINTHHLPFLVLEE